jgi:hypothetical protein
MLEIMTSKMTIDLNIFSSFMKIWVVSNLNRTLVVTKQYIGVGWENETLISASNQHNQTIYLVIDVITQYSTLVENWKTINYLLLFQEIRESPKKYKN